MSQRQKSSCSKRPKHAQTLSTRSTVNTQPTTYPPVRRPTTNMLIYLINRFVLPQLKRDKLLIGARIRRRTDKRDGKSNPLELPWAASNTGECVRCACALCVFAVLHAFAPPYIVHYIIVACVCVFLRLAVVFTSSVPVACAERASIWMDRIFHWKIARIRASVRSPQSMLV